MPYEFVTGTEKPNDPMRRYRNPYAGRGWAIIIVKDVTSVGDLVDVRPLGFLRIDAALPLLWDINADDYRGIDLEANFRLNVRDADGMTRTNGVFWVGVTNLVGRDTIDVPVAIIGDVA